MKKREKEKKSLSIFKLLFVIIIFLVICICSLALYTNITTYSYVSADGNEEEIFGKKECVSALICGVNDNLTDTIMYINYNTQNGKLFIMSIPRDTYVENEYCVGHKINAIYRGKNIVPLIEEVQELLNTKIDYYAIFDTEIVNKLVDEIGGVKVDVPFDMKYDDPTQDLHIDLEQGVQVLNGKQAEQFVRFRHNNDMSVAYAMGDLGRVKTQQEFMKSLAKSLFNPINVFKIPSIANIILEDTKTNITTSDILRYILNVAKLDIDNIKTTTASGTPKYINGVSYFLLDEEKTRNEISSIE